MTKNTLFRKTYAEIHLKALKDNYRSLKKLISENDFFCPMVKANAYGHGDIEVTRTLESEGVSHVGVAMIEEGIRLRLAQIQKLDILVFGSFTIEGAQKVVEYRLTPVLSRYEDLEIFNTVLKDNKKYPVHLKFNTGMFRMGFDPQKINELSSYFQKQNKMQVEGVCTHLSDGEDLGVKNGFSQKQFEVFKQIVKKINNPQIHVHWLNSAAMIGAHCRKFSYDNLPMGARPGIALYGSKPELVSPSEKEKSCWSSVVIKPVMQLKSELILIHDLQKGDRVSYNGRWTAEKAQKVGVIPIGYADGFSRQNLNKAVVLFRNQKVPVAGTVCMDYIMADITQTADKKPFHWGEEVVIFGQQGDKEIHVNEVAARLNTISYEVLTSVSSRVPRIYIG